MMLKHFKGSGRSLNLRKLLKKKLTKKKDSESSKNDEGMKVKQNMFIFCFVLSSKHAKMLYLILYHNPSNAKKQHTSNVEFSCVLSCVLPSNLSTTARTIVSCQFLCVLFINSAFSPHKFTFNLPWVLLSDTSMSRRVHLVLLPAGLLSGS